MNTIKNIGIIGHGRFGKLLERLLPVIFPVANVIIYSRREKPDSKRFFTFDETVHSDLVIPAVPIHSFEEIIKAISAEINKDAIIMDVCSVKEFPVDVMKRNLPSTITIIAGHPLFGPGTIQKQNGDLKHLKIMMSFVSGSNKKFNEVKSAFHQTFNIIEINPREHDLQMAKSQFISHLTAGILNSTGFNKTAIDTRSAETLHDFMSMIQPEAQLLKDMYTYNSHCKNVLKKFIGANKQIINLLET
jgi:prephenate dehydrogenase